MAFLETDENSLQRLNRDSIELLFEKNVCLMVNTVMMGYLKKIFWRELTGLRLGNQNANVKVWVLKRGRVLIVLSMSRDQGRSYPIHWAKKRAPWKRQWDLGAMVISQTGIQHSYPFHVSQKLHLFANEVRRPIVIERFL